jgi:hypothetical protein
MTVRFDAAFLDRRMSEHQRWQHDVLKELLDEVLNEMAEVIQAPAFAKRAKAQSLPFPEPRGPVRRQRYAEKDGTEFSSPRAVTRAVR